MKRLFSIALIALIGSPAAAQTKAAGQAPPRAQAATKTEDCGCDAKVPADLFAIVNGVKITAGDVDEPIRKSLDGVRNQVIEARGRELYLQINSRLLDAEAKKRGINSPKLLEQEVISKVKDPDESELQSFYDRNKSRIQGEFKDVKSQLAEHLRNQRQGEEAKKFADRLRAGADVKVFVEKVAAPSRESDRTRALAAVNGAEIKSADVEDALKPLIFDAQEQMYKLRKGQMDMAINSLLLEQEAQRRKVTARALLEAEVTPKVKPLSREDPRKFYDENKEKITGGYDQVKDQIIQYLREKEEYDAQGAFAARLRKAAAIEVFLTAPEPPVYNIAADDQPYKGRADAPVIIVEFTDFECPSCAQTQPIIERLFAEYGDRVKVVVRDFPLEKHKNAFKAAEAAEAAREQGKYWPFVEMLFQNQSSLGVESLKGYATRLGLDREKFDQGLESGRFADKVQRDLQEGMRLGVSGTPAVFVNGRFMTERSYEALKSEIETVLAQRSKGSAVEGRTSRGQTSPRQSGHR